MRLSASIILAELGWAVFNSCSRNVSANVGTYTDPQIREAANGANFKQRTVSKMYLVPKIVISSRPDCTRALQSFQ